MRLEYFQMVDRIDSVSDDPPRLVASARIPETATIFEGHFPGHPLMPGVLLVETMAQTAGYLLLDRIGFARFPFLVSIRDAKLRAFVTPATDLTIESVIDHEGSGYMVTKNSIHTPDGLACTATLTMRLIDYPSADFESFVRKHARERGLPDRPAP